MRKTEEINAPQNIEFLRKAKKIFFVAMNAELDAQSTSSPVVFTGVGKARATRAIVKYIFDNQELFKGPDAPIIVSLGTAGSARYNKGEIILVDNFFNNGDSFIREQISFDTLPCPTGRICGSSDFFVGPENFDQSKIESMQKQFDCMDMESFALANVCKMLGIRFCAVKCISDGADSTVTNFDEELPRFRAILNEFAKSLSTPCSRTSK